jgi:AcrR family transcriptional regulator
MAQPVQQRSIQTRQRLLQVAADMAVDQGLAGLRTEAIVERAGVAKGIFFAHFPDKDHLVAELVAARLAALIPPKADDLPAFLAALEPLFALMTAEPQVLDILARFAAPAGQAAGLDDVICDLIGAQAAQLAALQARGLARPTPDPATLAEGVFAFLLHAAASAQCPASAPDRPARQQAARDLLARLVTAWLAP